MVKVVITYFGYNYIKVMKNLLIIVLAIVLVQCEPVIPQKSGPEKRIIFDNQEYESVVGNVRVSPIEAGSVNILGNPAVNLNSEDQLILEFDLLTDQFENLSAQIYHCNKDWSKSILRDMEFFEEINNFRITDFDYSVNTVQPYINYRFQIPKPSISGNYVVAVFRRGNPKDVLFTRRFLIFQTAIAIDQVVRVSTTINKRKENQQIEFSIAYGNLQVNLPAQDLSVSILQNHNWNTALHNIPPTLIRANAGSMEYRHLDLKTNFAGWNEFRWTDLRTLGIAGRNVARVQNTGSEVFAQLRTDRSRGGRGYSQNFQDINGQYIIENDDPGESVLNADYARTRFILQHEQVTGKVFVTGRFNDWRLTDANLMNYDAQKGVYYTDLYLKQGYYDYLYTVEGGTAPNFEFEGSHFQTENDYEILVYYRRPGEINDQLMGYKKFKSIEDF